jgi:hypothetical protein
MSVNIRDLYGQLEILDTTTFKNRYAIIAKIVDGQIFVGDFIELEVNGKTQLFQIEAIYLYDYTPVVTAVKGETVVIPLFIRPVKVNNGIEVKSYRDYTPYIASLGLVQTVATQKKITESHLATILESKTHLYEFTEKMVSEGFFDQLISKGLKFLMTPVKGAAGFAWDNKKGIAISVALGLIAKGLWDKYSDPCNRPFRSKEEKLRCLQQAAQRLADELRREQAACLQLVDPIQKRKCLLKVEKLRRKWIQKSAEIKNELMQPK